MNNTPYHYQELGTSKAIDFSTCKPIPLAAWEAIEDPENEDLMMLGQTIN